MNLSAQPFTEYLKFHNSGGIHRSGRQADPQL